MAVRSKQTNHLISILCLSVFGLSLFCAGIFGIVLFRQYQENERLQRQYDEMQEEYRNIQEMYDNTDDEGYYNAYSDGELVIYGVGGTIIVG